MPSAWTRSTSSPTSIRPSGTRRACPGTTKYRIRPDKTGFTHLFIAGDWTDCGLNFGCVEAAVDLRAAGVVGHQRLSRHETDSRVHQTGRPRQGGEGRQLDGATERRSIE